MVMTPGKRLFFSLLALTAVLAAVVLFALSIGYQDITWKDLQTSDSARMVFFRLRVPRVVLAVLVGASLSIVGAALQALFRNPLAEPFTLGVSGGGALGASVAIALGFGASLAGIPMVFLTAFAGAALFVAIVYRLASAGPVFLPGALLLAGVVLNMIAGAGVLLIQFVTDYTRALQILRWMVGTLDVVGMDLVYRMALFLVPGLLLLLYTTRDLHLIAMDEESAAALGVDVRKVERTVYAASSLVVGVAVAVAGPIGFVGLIVPHAVRLVLGEDLRIVIPCSMLLGAGFLVAADTLARTLLGASELPVGAVTALLGGPLFLALLARKTRYAAI
jgi:iron complex transport system permease protein